MPTERVTRVRDLADALELLPEQMRVEAADKLDGLGLRRNAEHAFPEHEIDDIASKLYMVAAPMRKPFACLLRARGVTVDEESATLSLESQGPSWMGNHRPQHPVKKTAAEQGMEFVEHFMPEVAEQIRNAKTEQEKAALAQLLLQRHKQANSEATDLAAKTPPEEFG